MTGPARATSPGVGRWVAVRGADDRSVLAGRLLRAREALITGAGAETLGLRGIVERSWIRCAASADLRSSIPPSAFASDEAAERFASSPLAVGGPILREFKDLLDPSDDELMIVTDAHGTVLWTDGTVSALDSGEAVGVVPGARWGEAVSGTNGMGTALAAGHPVQIFAAEHLRPGVEGWVCNAAPIRDPESGVPVGAVDLSGSYHGAHPHSLLAVITVARSIEQALITRAVAERSRLHAASGAMVGTAGPVALVNHAGHVLETTRASWRGQRIDVADPDGGPVFIEGEFVVAEPVQGGYLLWDAAPSRVTQQSKAERFALRALGRDRALVTIGEQVVELSRRHSEILVLLTMHPEGLTDEQIALRIWGERGRPGTARAELSRLRRILGTRVTASPHRVRVPVASDVTDVEALIRTGQMKEALDRLDGPLLPRSESPEIVEARERLEFGVRSAVLGLEDPDLLMRWIQHPCGADDLVACRRLAHLLQADHTGRAAVLSRLRRLSQPVVAARPDW